MPEKQEIPPHYYVPSYVYKGGIQPSMPHPQQVAQQSKQAAAKNPPTETKKERLETSKQGIYQPSALTVEKPDRKVNPQAKSVLSMSRDTLKTMQHEAIQSSLTNEDPIYLVGDMNSVADPLIKMMGHALSANFSYPRIPGELGIKGRVIVKITLHPEGNITDVQMLQSSQNADLDAAALFAINKAPVIYGVDRFLKEPKQFVVGFIFH